MSKVTQKGRQNWDMSWLLQLCLHFPRVPLFTPHDCADISNVCLGAQSRVLPLERQGWRSCDTSTCQRSKQSVSVCRGGPLLLPERPTPTPRHLGALRLGDSVGPSQTPKPFRWPFPSFLSESGPVIPVGISADGEMETQEDPRHRVTLSVFSTPSCRCSTNHCQMQGMNKTPHRLSPASGVRQIFHKFQHPSTLESL